MLRLLVSLGCAGLPLSAQFAVGTRDVAWPNTTGQGSPSLTARVHDPATSAGSNAPILPRAGNAARVAAPLAIVAGQGDTIAPAAAYAVLYHQSLGAVAGIHSLHLLNGDATHTNLAGLVVSGGAGAQVFARVADFGDGWFAHWLGLSNTALERCAEPRCARSRGSCR